MRTAVDDLFDRYIHWSSHEAEKTENDKPGEDSGEIVCQRHDQRISVIHSIVRNVQFSSKISLIFMIKNDIIFLQYKAKNLSH